MPGDIERTIEVYEEAIRKSQILMLAGGLSAGDEPDGAGKFINIVLQKARIKEAINDLMEKRDGLILGINDGFHALIKLGLLPFGK